MRTGILIVTVSIWLSACQAKQTSENAGCQFSPDTKIEIKAGTTILGNNKAYPEEAEREASVRDFNIDAYEVTNRQFAKFVKETEYVTTAEKPQVGFDVPGAAVFKSPSVDHTNWWQFVEGANWRRPEGPNSTIKGKDTEPVVQVSHEDALAYAKWAGRDLPTEDEWEYAAKAGSTSMYVWGEDRAPGGKEMANTWQGAFPIKNTLNDRYEGRAPVGCFPANKHGLYDMIGNVWEWTKSDYVESATAPTYTIKGGSYLCAENYCVRYRASARQPQEADLPTNHIGFRTVSKQMD